jgi:hypothetical protein
MVTTIQWSMVDGLWLTVFWLMFMVEVIVDGLYKVDGFWL